MTDQSSPRPLGFFDPYHLVPGPMGRSLHWTLKDRIAYPATNLYAWARWRAEHEAECVVAVDAIDGVGVVSTVFLGMDYNHGPAGPPILFETQVFLAEGGTGIMERYALWDEAAAGHAKVLRLVKGEIEAARDLSIEALVDIMVNNKNGS